jgi:hypothetical protein
MRASTDCNRPNTETLSPNKCAAPTASTEAHPFRSTRRPIPKRWAWNVFCILCLLVFVGSIALWVRSHFVTADIERFSRQTEPARHPTLTKTLGYGIGWAPGRLGIFHYRGESSVPATRVHNWIYREFGPKRTLNTPPAPADRVNLQFGRFQFLYRVETTAGNWLSLRLLTLPFWVFLLAAIPPSMWWRHWRSPRSASAPPLVPGT